MSKYYLEYFYDAVKKEISIFIKTPLVILSSVSDNNLEIECRSQEW